MSEPTDPPPPSEGGDGVLAETSAPAEDGHNDMMAEAHTAADEGREGDAAAKDTPEDLAKEPAGASKGEVSQEQVAEGARTPEADLAETSYGPPPPAEGQSDPPSTLDTLVEEAHVRDAEEAGTGAGEATTQRDIARDMSRAEAAAIIQLAARGALDRGDLNSGGADAGADAAGGDASAAPAEEAGPEGGVGGRGDSSTEHGHDYSHGVQVDIGVAEDNSVTVQMSPRRPPGAGQAADGGAPRDWGAVDEPLASQSSPAPPVAESLDASPHATTRGSHGHGKGKRGKRPKPMRDVGRASGSKVEAEGSPGSRTSTVANLERKLAMRVIDLDMSAVGQLLAAAQRMGVPETNRYVELAHAVVYLNSLANEVSYACRFHHADILPRTLDAIACTVAGQADGDEVELDEETSEQYRRAERAVHAAQLDLQASIAIEIGDQARMDELEAQAAAEGCPQVAARIRAARHLEETKASVLTWLEEKEAAAQKARMERLSKKKEQKKAEEELAERKQRNQAAFQAWLAQDAERRKERGLKAREAGDKQTIDDFLEEERQKQEENEQRFREWLARKKQGGAQQRQRQPSAAVKQRKLQDALRTSREMEEAAFKVLEQGWTCDVRVHVAPTEKAGRQRGAREQAQ